MKSKVVHLVSFIPMAMQVVPHVATFGGHKELQMHCWCLEISGCQNYQPNISKIDLNNFVAHHFS